MNILDTGSLIDRARLATRFNRLVIILQREIGPRLAAIKMDEVRIVRAHPNPLVEIFKAFVEFPEVSVVEAQDSEGAHVGRVEGERLRLQFVGPLKVAFRVTGKASLPERQELGSQIHQGADIVGIDGERLFAERVCRIRFLADPSGLPRVCVALESQVLGVGFRRGSPFEAGGLSVGESNIDCARQMRRILL
jgi:hypothetical protein